MTITAANDRGRHLRQEAEANGFAIELLAPRKRVRRQISGAPDLKRVLQMATAFDISKEAAARRYVSLHTENLAVVFCKDGQFIYADRPKRFPWLCLRNGSPMPLLPQSGANSALSMIEETDPSDWLERPKETSLTAQTLHQQDGYALTLLCAEITDDDPDEIDDTFERFSRLSD